MSTITLPDFLPPLESGLLVMVRADPETGRILYAICYSTDGGKTWNAVEADKALAITEFNVVIPNNE